MNWLPGVRPRLSPSPQARPRDRRWSATRRLPLAGALFAAASVIAQSEDNAGSSVRFTRDIAPVLAQKCVACHGAEKTKGGYRVDTYERLLQPGDSKALPIEPGRPDTSDVVRRLTSADPDDRMPQKDDPLPGEHIRRFKRWILDGATFDGPDPRAAISSYLPRAPYPDPPAHYAARPPITAIAWAPDGKSLAVGGIHEVLVWDLAARAWTRRIRGFGRRIQGLAQHPDGTRLFALAGSPGQYGDVLCLDTATNAPPRTLASLPDTALCLALSPDGSQLAVGATDGAVRLWSVSGEPRVRFVIRQHADWVVDVAWSPDGKRLATASHDKTARVFSAGDGGLETTYTSHSAALLAVGWVAPDRILTSARDRQLHVWAIEDGKKLFEVAGVDGDGLRFADGSGRTTILTARGSAFALAAGAKTATPWSSGGFWSYALSVSPDGRATAVGLEDGRVRLLAPSGAALDTAEPVLP